MNEQRTGVKYTAKDTLNDIKFGYRRRIPVAAYKLDATALARGVRNNKYVIVDSGWYDDTMKRLEIMAKHILGKE